MSAMPVRPASKETYSEVSRHLDAATEEKLKASPIFPPEWVGNAKLQRAHQLWWLEQETTQRSRTVESDHDAVLTEACRNGHHPV